MAPTTLDASAIERIVRSKRLWLHKTLTRKRETQHPTVRREFVSGEGFFYLGRSYRLKLTDDHQPQRCVTQHGGRLLLPRVFASDGKRLLIAWYRARAKEWTADAVARLAPRTGA